eukprot:scaffold1569_cov171-Amphora_coffeaeformis.AAC.22
MMDTSSAGYSWELAELARDEIRWVIFRSHKPGTRGRHHDHERTRCLHCIPMIERKTPFIIIFWQRKSFLDSLNWIRGCGNLLVLFGTPEPAHNQSTCLATRSPGYTLPDKQKRRHCLVTLWVGYTPHNLPLLLFGFLGLGSSRSLDLVLAHNLSIFLTNQNERLFVFFIVEVTGKHVGDRDTQVFGDGLNVFHAFEFGKDPPIFRGHDLRFASPETQLGGIFKGTKDQALETNFGTGFQDDTGHVLFNGRFEAFPILGDQKGLLTTRGGQFDCFGVVEIGHLDLHIFELGQAFGLFGGKDTDDGHHAQSLFTQDPYHGRSLLRICIENDYLRNIGVALRRSTVGFVRDASTGRRTRQMFGPLLHKGSTRSRLIASIPFRRGCIGNALGIILVGHSDGDGPIQSIIGVPLGQNLLVECGFQIQTHTAGIKESNECDAAGINGDGDSKEIDRESKRLGKRFRRPKQPSEKKFALLLLLLDG